MVDLSLRVVPKVYKTIVVGEKGVGKTAIINQFILNAFIEDFDQLIWTNYTKQAIVDNHAALLEISDTIAYNSEMQETLHMVWEHDIRESDAALLVYSITSRETFLRVAALRDAILAVTGADGETSGASESQKVRSIQIVLMGNKSDQRIDREVSVEEGVELAEVLGCGFVETCAKTGYNVNMAFYDLVRAVDKDIANGQQCEDQVSAGGGFRRKLGRLSRSFGFKKTQA